MVKMYALLAWIAQSVGMFSFIAAFAAITLYALWPRNKAKFAEAAAAPLRED
jgi:cytochrome c oxidase cbb3-type subunit IV